MLKRKELYLIIFIFVLGLMIGIIIGYYTSPFGIFECFKKFDYKNITCYQESDAYHCLIQDGTGYRIENVVRK